MYPVLFTVGPITVYILGISIVAGWVFYSFLLWRALKDQGIDDDRIFTLTFYATIFAFVFSRAGYVVTHWDFFRENWFRIFVPWVAPGYSFFGAAIGAIAVYFAAVKTMKIKAPLLFEAAVFAGFFAHAFGSLGALFDGAVVGRLYESPWSVIYAGHPSARHPSGLYFLLADTLAILVYLLMRKIVFRKISWKPAVSAFTLWFWAGLLFLIEFSVESPVYWAGLSINQWFLLVLFSEISGIIFIKTGTGGKVRQGCRHVFETVRERSVKIYAEFKSRTVGSRQK